MSEPKKAMTAESQNYIDWHNELLTEDEGYSIVKKSTSEELYILFERVTGKKALI